MNEAGFNESERRAEFTDPALKEAGWGVGESSRVLREIITQTFYCCSVMMRGC